MKRASAFTASLTLLQPTLNTIRPTRIDQTKLDLGCGCIAFESRPENEGQMKHNINRITPIYLRLNLDHYRLLKSIFSLSASSKKLHTQNICLLQ